MAASESELATQESCFVPPVNPPAAPTLNPLCQGGVSSDCPEEHLQQRIESFIAYFNATMAKPFRWTMKGKPLVA
jgi:hypothetical protein